MNSSQQQILSFIGLAPLSIAMFDRDMRYLAVSARWVVDYGRGHTDLTGKSHYEIHPDLPARWIEAYRRGLAGETLKNDDDLWVQADGSKHWLHWSVTPWRDPHGEIGGIIISTENITERKRTEAALRAREEHFRTLFEEATDGILVSDAHGQLVDVNSAACLQLGYAREELLSMNVVRIVLPEDVERLAVEIAQLIEAGGKSIRSEWQVRRKDGSIFLCEVTSKQLLDGRLQAILRDVTETRRIQTQLQERQHFLQQVLDAEPGTVYIFDLAASSNIYINRHALTAYGYSPEETAAMGAEVLNRMASPHDLARIAAHHDAWRQAGEGEIRDIEYHLRTKSGEWRWLHSRETAFARDSAGQVTQILGIAHDITERRRAETALRESENRLNIAQRIGAIGSWEWDLATDVITGSHQLYQLISVDPANADSNVLAMIDRCIHPGDSERVRRLFEENRAQGKYLPLEFRVMKPDGTVRWVMSQGDVETGAHGKPVRLFGVLQDITARKHMEDALRDSERKLRLVIDGLGPSVFVGLMTPDGVVIVANHSALAAAGLRLEDVAGKPVEETYWFSYSASVQAQLRAAVTRAQRGESSRYDVPIRVTDSETIWIDLSFTPVLRA